MDITANLASQPFVDSRPIVRVLRIAIAAVIATTIAVGLAAFLVHNRAREVHERAHAIQADLNKLEAEQHAYRNLMYSSSTVDVAKQAEELNQIFEAKAFSWTAVMQELEGVLPRKVQVTAIEPMRTKDGSTILHLRVVGPHEESIDLLRNLEQAKSFQQPRIVGESLANTLGAGQKSVAVDASTMMEFDIMVQYGGPASHPPASGHAGDFPSTQPIVTTTSYRKVAQSDSVTLAKRGSQNGGPH